MRFALRPVFFALCSLPIALFAQYFTIGTDPASVRWNQIKTSHFKLIYPVSLEAQAKYIANAFEYGYKPVSASLNVTPRRWPVILHNQSVISNALTPYAPKRIEIFTMPPQDNYSQDWMDQLIIHEFRHSAQYSSINRGLTHALSFVFGQQAVPAVLGLFVPLWFIEGDAVVTETALSHSGRGRISYFEMKLRAQFLEKGIYSYDKAVNGSYKDFIPDHYELGYLLVGQTRIQYGKETWSRVMRRTGNIPLMLVPFSNTLYKETGYSKSGLYANITSNLQQSWLSVDKELNPTFFLPVLKSKEKFYSNRTQPSALSDGRIITRKSSIYDITRITIIDKTGTENKLLSPGSMVDKCLSVAGNLLCWAEMVRDPRWDLRTYSVIMLHDLQTGHTRQITNNTRYFSPDLCRDGSKITTVEVDQMNQYFLVILDIENGEVIHRFPTPNNFFPSHPAWSIDGKQIAVILTRDDEGKSLVIADANSGEFKLLLPFSNTEISKPSFYYNYILFTGAYTGIDNIFALNPDSNKLYQVTSSRFGATDAIVSPYGLHLYYTNYTSSGYELAWTLLNPYSWKKWNPANLHHFELADALASQENFIFNAGEVPDSAFISKPYRKGLNLFNFHSWGPFSADIDNMNFKPGVSLFSQNLLGTSYTSLGYEYDLNEEEGKYFLKYSYEGLYPAIDLNMDYGLRRGTHTDSTGGKTNYKFHELNLAAGVRIPLNWYVRSWFVGFQPYAGYSYKFLRMDPGSELKFRKDRFHSFDYRLFFYAQLQQTYRDLIPRWGQLLEFNYRHTPFDGDSASSIFAAQIVLYFPGLFRHHGFRFYGGYQDRLVDYYRYGGLISLPRGYSGIFADRVLSGSVSYEFPIFYPDWHIGPVIYMKRLKAALFYDHAWIFDTEPGQSYNSIGADLTLDFHLFRHFAPLEAGLRSIYFPESGRFEFEFLYRLNLDGIY